VRLVESAAPPRWFAERGPESKDIHAERPNDWRLVTSPGFGRPTARSGIGSLFAIEMAIERFDQENQDWGTLQQTRVYTTIEKWLARTMPPWVDTKYLSEHAYVLYCTYLAKHGSTIGMD
jgi:hypothetical protein